MKKYSIFSLFSEILNTFSISSLVEKLCRNYGPKICDVNGIAYHAFPNYDELMDPKVKNLSVEFFNFLIHQNKLLI